jgi:diaminopimelate decarboxylase
MSETTSTKFKEWMGLVQRFGSPIYVYDLDKVQQRVKELKNALPENSCILYSLKSNPLPSLVKAAVSTGCVPEVCSSNELSVGVEANGDVDYMLYSGPGKNSEEIRFAIENGVRKFSAESWGDLERLSKVSEETKSKISVLLRINPSAELKSGLAMSGTASQFGFEEQDLIDQAVRFGTLSPNVSIDGFHVYFGTQIPNQESLLESFSSGIASIELLSSKIDISPKVIDLGGGFPWHYAKEGEQVNLDKLKDGLTEILSKRLYSAGAEIWFEAGRYISASSGTLISTVMDIKESKNKTRFVVLDSGINHLGGMSGVGRIPRGYVSLYDKDKSVTSVDDNNNRDIKRTSLVGPLCSPLDCLSRNINLDGLRAGDIVAIPNVGAYGVTASLVGFLTRPAPIEISTMGGEVVESYQLRTGHQKLDLVDFKF